MPGVSRAQSRVERLELTSSNQIAHLQIHLEPRVDYPRFRIALRTGRGEKVLTRDNLQRSRHAGGYAIQFDVPASALPAGDYELELRGGPGG